MAQQTIAGGQTSKTVTENLNNNFSELYAEDQTLDTKIDTNFNSIGTQRLHYEGNFMLKTFSEVDCTDTIEKSKIDFYIIGNIVFYNVTVKFKNAASFPDGSNITGFWDNAELGRQANGTTFIVPKPLTVIGVPDALHPNFIIDNNAGANNWDTAVQGYEFSWTLYSGVAGQGIYTDNSAGGVTSMGTGQVLDNISNSRTQCKFDRLYDNSTFSGYLDGTILNAGLNWARANGRPNLFLKFSGYYYGNFAVTT